MKTSEAIMLFEEINNRSMNPLLIENILRDFQRDGMEDFNVWKLLVRYSVLKGLGDYLRSK